MDYNYHTHTFRCGHATGTEREYIERALANGVKDMGFSDHAPYRFKDGYESGFRVPVSLTQDYIDSLKELKYEYDGRINISIGFEAEYFDSYGKEIIDNAIKCGAQYLILGQHYIKSEREADCLCFSPHSDADFLKHYAKAITDAVATGVFSYIAHPDAVNFSGDENDYIRIMEEVCLASKEYGVPLEINFLGIRGARHYPKKAFWELAGKIKCPVTFGLDAHQAHDAYDAESLKAAKALAEECKLNYIGKPRLVMLNK